MKNVAMKRALLYLVAVTILLLTASVATAVIVQQPINSTWPRVASFVTAGAILLFVTRRRRPRRLP